MKKETGEKGFLTEVLVVGYYTVKRLTLLQEVKKKELFSASDVGKPVLRIVNKAVANFFLLIAL